MARCGRISLGYRQSCAIKYLHIHTCTSIGVLHTLAQVHKHTHTHLRESQDAVKGNAVRARGVHSSNDLVVNGKLDGDDVDISSPDGQPVPG